MKYLLTVLIALLAGFAGAAAFSFSGLGNENTRTYLAENPVVLRDMIEGLQASEAQERLAQVEGDVKTPFQGAVLGNPQGTKTLVKFTDYSCGYCRASVEDVDRLIAANPDLRVIVRERAIFASSEAAARMGLAAAAQGKYDEFYHAMFALGVPTAEKIASAARTAGIDMEAAREFGASQQVTAELVRNDELARQLGIPGTPSWVYGDTVFEGAVGYQQLSEIVASNEG